MTQGKGGLYYEMKDNEMVLRFFALRGTHKLGTLEEIMDDTMEHENKIDIESVNILKVEFHERLKFLMEHFDDRPFDMRRRYHQDRKISFEL